MMGWLNLVLPWWAKWAALAALIAASNGYTYLKTHAAGEAKLDAWRAEVEFAGKLQAARVAEQVTAQERITQGVVNGWDQTVKDLRAQYAPHDHPPRRAVGAAVGGGLRQPPAAGSGPVPALPDATARVDDAAPDCRLADAAETTLMLVRLQEWVRLQAAVMP